MPVAPRSTATYCAERKAVVALPAPADRGHLAAPAAQQLQGQPPQPARGAVDQDALAAAFAAVSPLERTASHIVVNE